MARREEYRIPERPDYITRARPPIGDGRVPGIDNSMWVWFEVPLAPVTDTKDKNASTMAGAQLDSFFRGLGALSGRVINRRASRSNYRQFHVQWLGIPQWFESPEHLPTAAELNRWFFNSLERRLGLIIGVKLHTSYAGKSLWENLDSVRETWMTRRAPASDYDADWAAVSDLAARCGLRYASPDELKWADSWWNHGVPRTVPVVLHDEHMHLFRTGEARREVELHHDTADCSTWADLDGQSALTFAVAQDFDYGAATMSVEDEFVRFGPALAKQGARVISIRGFVEPARATQQEIAGQSRRHNSDEEAAAEKGKKARGEVQQHIQLLDELEHLYATNRADIPPTLIDLSIVVGFDGIVDDIDRIQAGPMTLVPATNVVGAAWHETMLCSGVDANPIKLELPSSAISFGGLQDQSRVGDKPDGNVALAGFTEDRQAVWVSPGSASAGDTYPLMALLGATGSGKTSVAQWLAWQWSVNGAPVLFFDPKSGSDLSPIAALAGGSVTSVDSILDSDGILDPLRYSQNPVSEIGLAISICGVALGRDQYKYETELSRAVNYGVTNGARGIGVALQLARDAGQLGQELHDRILSVADSSPMFRASFAMTNEGKSLSVSESFTLISMGESHLRLPQWNSTVPLEQEPLEVRLSVNLARMIVRAGMTALRGRGGVLMMDEAWVLDLAAADELDELGRVARQYDVLPVYMTQTPSKPAERGIGKYFSRGFIGHIKRSTGLGEADEAQAAMDLFGIDDPQVKGRIEADAFLPGGRGTNWNTLKAVWDDPSSKTRELLRPAQFYHSDLSNSIAPVTVEIPAEFMELASTNPEDLRRRLAAQQGMSDG